MPTNGQDDVHAFDSARYGPRCRHDLLRHCTLDAQSVQASKKILMLYSYDPNAPGTVAFAEQLKAVVSEQFPDRAEIYDEYLDTNRFPGRDRSLEFARYFAAKYQGFRPDAIVAQGTPALRFATERLSSLFPGVPIVYGQAFEPGLDFSALPEMSPAGDSRCRSSRPTHWRGRSSRMRSGWSW